MPQLDPTWFASQLFWLAVSVVFLYLMLSRAILPPLMRALELRQSTRENDLSRAQAFKTEAEKAREEYELALADARLRAQSIFADAERSGRVAAESALADATRALNAKTAEAEKRIAGSKESLMKSLEPALADLTAMTVEKVLGVKPDAVRTQAAIKQQLNS